MQRIERPVLSFNVPVVTSAELAVNATVSTFVDGAVVVQNLVELPITEPPVGNPPEFPLNDVDTALKPLLLVAPVLGAFQY